MRDPYIDKLIQDAKARKFEKEQGDKLTTSFGEKLQKDFGPAISKAIKEGLSAIKMPDMPKMPNIPESKMPEIPQPVVNVEAPVVNVPAPVVHIPAPIVNIPETKFPDYPEFPSEFTLKGIAPKTPLPVQIMDMAGKPYFPGQGGGATGGRADFFAIRDIQTSSGASIIDQVDGALKVVGSFSVLASNNSTQVIDSSNQPFGTAANPINVAITSGAASSTKAQIGNSDGDFSAANPLNVTFAPSGSQNVNVFDGQASTVTSHQYPLTSDFRGLDTALMNVVNVSSVLNSSVATLGVGGEFTGGVEDVLNYASITFYVFSDVSSSTNGFQILQSNDGSNFDVSDTYTIPAATGKVFSVQPASRYLRVFYANGGTSQTSFRLSQSNHFVPAQPSSQRPSDAYTNETDMQQFWGFVSSWNGTTWDRVSNQPGVSTNALRVQMATDVVTSTYIQNPVDNGDSATAIRVVIAGNSSASVSASQAGTWTVNGITNTIATNLVDSSGVAYSGSNPLPIVGPVVVTSVTNSIQSALIDSSGIQYSGSNPVPITGTTVVSSVTATIAAANIDSSGVQYSGSNPFPFTLVTNATSTMNVALTDSGGVQYSGSNPVPITGTVVVSSITASTQSALIDSSGVQYSGSNPVPVTVVSGTLTSTKAQIGNSDGDFTQANPLPIINVAGGNDSIFTYMARTTNPTAVADGADVRPKADKLGRALMRPVQVRDLIATAYVALANGTETTLLAGAAGVFQDLIMITATNNSTAAVQLDIRAVTAGNIIHTMYLPATTGPVGFAPSVPWPQDATGNNWTIDMGDFTNTTVYVSALFSKEI